MRTKPEKPRADFPLFSHASGKWAKKIKGKLRYFGRWEDPEAALAEYEALIALGEDAKPTKPAPTALTVEDACDHFCCFKEGQVSEGVLSPRSFREYLRTCKRFSEFIGYERPIEDLEPLDFARYRESIAKRWNPLSVGNEVTRVLTLLKWLKKHRYTGEIEVSSCFRKPSEKVVRRYRRQRGKLLFTAQDILKMLDESPRQLQAMIWLGINCGFQNSDLERLPVEIALDSIESGWIEYPREKTEVERRCPLWPETVAAMAAVVDVRARRASEGTREFFLRIDGRAYSSDNNEIAKMFGQAREAAKVPCGGFSWLRKTFETVAGGCLDQVAVNYVMGHVDASMAAIYRQEIWDARLEAAT